VKRELGHEVLRKFGPVSSGYHGHPRDFGVPGLGVRVEKSWRRQVRPTARALPAVLAPERQHLGLSQPDPLLSAFFRHIADLELRCTQQDRPRNHPVPSRISILRRK